MNKVVRACQKHGKAPGVMASTTDEVKNAVDRGFRFIGEDLVEKSKHKVAVQACIYSLTLAMQEAA